MKKVFFSLTLIGFFIFIVGFFLWALLPVGPNSEVSKEFFVERGEGVFEIAPRLEKEGLIKNKLAFIVYLFLRGQTSNIKAGYYELSPSFSVGKIIQKLIAGDTIKEKITIIEGWRKEEIAIYLEEKGICLEKDFLDAVLLENWKEKYEFLKEAKTGDTEGYLFPDTYFIDYVSPRALAEKSSLERAKEIVERMLDNFDSKVTREMREEIKAQGKTIFEIVIMASLVEKEVKTKEDKELVSGVLWKRLESNMPLQVDATITFITGKKGVKVSKEETQIDSPYNTYKYRGLPIGPICNAGLESIIAAINPVPSDYWYYLSTPEGETIFSRTLEEHNLARDRYLR